MTLKWLGLIPWLVLLCGMPFLNHSDPMILGLPLPLAFSVACVLITAATLAVIYALDPANRS